MRSTRRVVFPFLEARRPDAHSEYPIVNLALDYMHMDY